MKSILREKFRYIKFKIISENEYTKQEFERCLRQALLGVLGEIGYSRCFPKLILYSSKEAIIKILRDQEKETRAAFALITRFDSAPIHLQVVFVSGTVLGCKGKK